MGRRRARETVRGIGDARRRGVGEDAGEVIARVGRAESARQGFEDDGDAIVGEVSPKRRPSEVETPRMEESKKEVSPTVTAIDSGNLSVPAGDCIIIETPEREIPSLIVAELGYVAENAATESTSGNAAAPPGIDDVFLSVATCDSSEQYTSA